MHDKFPLRDEVDLIYRIGKGDDLRWRKLRDKRFGTEDAGGAGVKQLNRALIAPLPLFADLSEADLDFVLQDARSFLVEKESAIFEQEVEAKSFYLLLHGHVRVERVTPDGHKIIVRYISEGELLGIAMVLGRTAYPATAMAAVDCTVLEWPNMRWPLLASRIPALIGNLVKTVGTRLEDAHTRVVEMSTERVEQRVAHTILRLLKQTGRKVEDGVEIDFPISRQDIAEMTGATLFTISRILSEWETLGLVRGGRQKIIVTQPHRLLVIAEGRN